MTADYRNKHAELLMKIAKKGLEICRETGDRFLTYFDKFVIGKSTFAIITRDPQTGRPEHSTWAVMETIYDDYRRHPELKINEDLQRVLENNLSNEYECSDLYNAIEALIYQMRSEKQETAPFKLNNTKLLNDLKGNIIQHKQELEMRNMMNELNNYNETLKEHYKQSIM